jgi:hypothetical protein
MNRKPEKVYTILTALRIEKNQNCLKNPVAEQVLLVVPGAPQRFSPLFFNLCVVIAQCLI